MNPEIIPGDAALLLLCDHASNFVPPGVELGIARELLDRHIALDIGAAPLTRALAAATGAAAVLATASRLVVDTNREVDHPTLVPPVSDGHPIRGNADADRFDRIARFHAPYHRAIAALVRERRPGLIVGVHSFTPRLESGNALDRRWEVGILSNRDRRAAERALALLGARGDLIVGDNEPYSGRALNATLNRHAEGQGVPSFAIEVRNDLIRDSRGVARWCDILARILVELRNELASTGASAT